jgi:hypothetical protein
MLLSVERIFFLGTKYDQKEIIHCGTSFNFYTCCCEEGIWIGNNSFKIAYLPKMLVFSKKALIFDDKLEQWVQAYSSALCVAARYDLWFARIVWCWLMGLSWSLICGKRRSGKQGEHDVPHELLITFTIKEPN